jgi:hypothetical protein
MPWTRVPLGIVLPTMLAAAAPAPRQHAEAGRITVNLATLHVARLSTARSSGDSADSPFLLLSLLQTSTPSLTRRVPDDAPWRLRTDAAVPSTPLLSMALSPGDTACVLVSVMEREAPGSPRDTALASASAQQLRRSGAPLLGPASGILASSLGQLTPDGANWIGSVSLLVTNEAGTIHWRRMECVQYCSVLQGPPDAASGMVVAPAGGHPPAAIGVFELTGDSAIYHLAVSMTLTP